MDLSSERESFESEIFSGPLTVFRHSAMASDFEISLNEKNSDFGADPVLTAFDEVDRIEDILSVFRPTSLVSRLNALAGEFPFRVPDELFQWISFCRNLSEQTDGAFDITCSPLWTVWGFARRQGGIPDKKNLEEARGKVGWQYLILNEEERTVRFDRPGAAISFGSVGKGIALDSASNILNRANLADYLFHGGRSSAIAKGGRQGDFFYDDGKKRSCWTIGVSHPLRPERRLAEIRLADRALGTSGSQYQFFRYRGKRYAHIIDPRSGEPVTGILSAVVLAPNARVADALSTAFFILGPDKTENWCKKHPEISALLLLETGSEPSVEMATFNLPSTIFRTL